jgi:hypothetical protein
MRILHVAHQQLRKYGHTRVSWAQKLYFGLIKNGFLVQTFSDRDVAAFEAPLGIRPWGERRANLRLLETAEAFQPDLVIVGHCDVIDNGTLSAIRAMKPGTVIVGCNNDPLFVPENADKIARRCEVVDAMFVSTGVVELKRFTGRRARLLHMPNPVDEAIECFDASRREDLEHDLIFCSKSEAYTSRGETVRFLKEKLPASLDFYTPGSFGVPGVWGLDYDRALAESRMGLNLNRQEGLHWYSSARMAQMGGNGLLVFTHRSGDFHTLFPPETLVYFDTQEELLGEVEAFHHDDARRRQWAANTREFFHRELNSARYARYIAEAGMGLPLSQEYVWHEQ